MLDKDFSVLVALAKIVETTFLPDNSIDEMADRRTFTDGIYGAKLSSLRCTAVFEQNHPIQHSTNLIVYLQIRWWGNWKRKWSTLYCAYPLFPRANIHCSHGQKSSTTLPIPPSTNLLVPISGYLLRYYTILSFGSKQISSFSVIAFHFT